MALVSVIQAAKLAKVSRKTVYQYIADGKLSCSKSHIGKTEIDTSELVRVFGELGDMPLSATGGRKVTAEKAADSPSIDVILENARLQAENVQLRERLGEARQDKEMLFARLSEAQASLKLLTPVHPGQNDKKGFWARLIGR
jgi:predicted site-specific integrase-resolvase